MKVKSLYIRDFGIFYNQALEDLGEGLIVIGGYNRAGKSTFMQILRHLGFGFPRGGVFPPARDKYAVEGELILPSREICTISLNGHAEPVIGFLNAKDVSITYRDIYNNLDINTYHQIFTISLDELMRIPRGFSENDAEKFQSVLLGAGLKEMAQIPSLEEAFLKVAEDIGGKKGSLGVKQFKSYSSMIKEGLKLREKALLQVEEYRNVQNRLKDVNSEIIEHEKEIERTEALIIRLDVLKNNFKNCSEKKRLEIMLFQLASELTDEDKNLTEGFLEKAKGLKEDYLKVAEEYRTGLLAFESRVRGRDVLTLKDKLIREERTIDSFAAKLSGLKEKVQNLMRMKEDCSIQRSETEEMINRINSSWEGDFERIKTIKCDEIMENELREVVEKYKSFKNEEIMEKTRLAELSEEEERLTGLIGERRVAGPETYLKRYFIIASVFVLLGIGMSFLHLFLGVAVIFLGAIGGALIFSFKSSSEVEIKSELKNLQNQLTDIKGQISRKSSLLEEVIKKKNEFKRQLEKYREALDLPIDGSLEILDKFAGDIKRVKQEVFRVQRLEEKIVEESLEIEAELTEIHKVLKTIYDELAGEAANGSLVKKSEVISDYVQLAKEHLELAKGLNSKELILNDVKDKIKEITAGSEGDLLEVLEDKIQRAEKAKELREYENNYKSVRLQILQSLKTDRVKRAMEMAGADVSNDEKLMSAFEELFEDCVSFEDVEKSYETAKMSLSELINNVNKLKEERQSLKDQIERLSTTENLEKAQKQIDEAREGLRFLVEKYAVNKAAAFILAEIRKNFMDKMKDSLLSQASKYLEKITGGEYQKILPPENLLKADFKTMTSDGRTDETTEILSRGTKEQLFLAVRISRIKEIETPLPVIIDDSLVNFDMKHLARALDLLIDLAKTHQIFILTCHPHLVKYIMDRDNGAQYWKLHKGRFDRMMGDELIYYLNTQ